MKRFVAAALVGLVACAGSAGEPVAKVNGRTLQLEVADTAAKRELGLMNRTSLSADAGMLFVFGAKTVNGFWMKNTRVPLSIAFLDGTTIVGIDEMTPCREDPCTIYAPSVAYDRAIEANQGWFTRAKAKVGGKIRLENLTIHRSTS